MTNAIYTSRLVQEARNLLGVPWRHQGRSERGLDCGGVWVLACRRSGFPMGDAPPGYSRYPKEYSFVEIFARHLDRVRLDAGRDSLQDGDVLISRGEVYPVHAAIAATAADGSRTVVEANASRRKVVERTLDQQRWDLVTHVFRVPGVIHDDR